MPKSKQPMELIALQVPSSWKQKLEEYCKANGYNLSYAIRKAVEDHILTPKFTWEDFLKWKSEVDQWKDWVNKKLGEIVSLISESWKLNQGDIKKLVEISEGLFKGQERIADCLNNINLQIQTLDFQIEVLFRILEKLTGQPIRQILAEALEEWKAKKKKETEKEKTSHE
jgi:hypothetical protein